MSQDLDLPQVSIVMPSFNQRAFLKEAVDSVFDQGGVNVELLVFDPGSTDGSRELLLELKEKYGTGLRLFFEGDRGQSDAVNKGMRHARANIMGWLNSDDRLRPGALARVASLLDTNGPAWVYGQAGVIDGQGREIGSLITSYKNLRGRTFSRFKLIQENFISQMGVFWTQAMWKNAGPLRVEKHLDMDYDLWLRFAAIEDPMVIREFLADFRVHAAAKGSLQSDAQLDAAFKTASEHSTGLGFKGKIALAIHGLLKARTSLAYRFLKPR